MALTPFDEKHALQIQAGTLGRTTGHQFEDRITKELNSLSYPFKPGCIGETHLFSGDPAMLLLSYVAVSHGLVEVSNVVALSTGALATSEEGKQWLLVNEVSIRRCKSDLVLTLHARDGKTLTVGVSTKQCNNRTPTNAQLYFTTAKGFSSLLQSNGIRVSRHAILALRQFCGDPGFRPSDHVKEMRIRKSDPRRYFWEEIDQRGRREWEAIFARHQAKITRLLLQKAYLNDPFVPDFVLHKTKKSNQWSDTEVAIYSVDELVAASTAYGGFVTRPYSIRKGSFRDPVGVTHLAPRFGFIQMQRGGQKQHPEQLQFNLKAGYFYAT